MVIFRICDSGCLSFGMEIFKMLLLKLALILSVSTSCGRVKDWKKLLDEVLEL
jgi:hypothetical protein